MDYSVAFRALYYSGRLIRTKVLAPCERRCRRRSLAVCSRFFVGVAKCTRACDLRLKDVILQTMRRGLHTEMNIAEPQCVEECVGKKSSEATSFLSFFFHL